MVTASWNLDTEEPQKDDKTDFYRYGEKLLYIEKFLICSVFKKMKIN